MQNISGKFVAILLTAITALARSSVVIKAVNWLVGKLLRSGKGYRSKVITENLKSTIAKDNSAFDIGRLKESYYGVLQRYFIEALMLAANKPEKTASWVKLEEGEKWKHWFQQQPGTIVMASHYGNWEIVIPLLPALLDMPVVGFYKPLSNKTLDQWVRKNRGRSGLDLQPIEQTARVMTSLKNKNVAYVFISDQSPVNLNGVHWNTFLGRKTPWLTGAEKLARKFGYPVVYLQQIPLNYAENFTQKSSGKNPEKPLYKVAFHLLTERAGETETGEITEKYTRLLEQEIQQDPKWWLWSHRRWKRADIFPAENEKHQII